MFKKMLVVVFVLGCAVIAGAQDSRLMRWPDLSQDQVVFTYEDDLWVVDETGGDARRITNHQGSERYAKFSPDGSMVAFSASYDGGTDVYLMDARGGVPTRLTWHPGPERVLGWVPDGSAVLFRADRLMPFRAQELYAVSIAGGQPWRLPVDRAGLAAISPDGTMLAYNRITREDRTWKRHKGGTAQNIWVGELATGEYLPVTDWEGTDNFPMWAGHDIVFTSDREHGTLNLYRLNPDSGEVTALTNFDDYDVKNPSMGPAGVVFQYEEALFILDLESGAVRRVPVAIRSDRVSVRTELVKAGDHTGSFRVSPDGQLLLLEARGELLALPTEDDDEPQNLTKTPGAREKEGVYSPDGSLIAFVSDRSGEEELWVMDRDGANARQLTDDGAGYRFRPVWSPDGASILFGDKSLRLALVDVESGETTEIDRGEYDDGWYRWGIQEYAYSPDSRWVVYTKLEASMFDSIFLHELSTGRTVRVTGPETKDWSPAFSRDGRYLYFLSDRTLEPVMGRLDQNHIFLNMTRAYLVLLEADQESPFVGGGDAEDAADDDGADEGGEGDEITSIDPEGIQDRVLLVEGIPAGDYDRLEATEDGFLYLARTDQPFLKYQEVTDRGTEDLELWAYDLGADEAEKVMDGVANYHLSADADFMAYKAGEQFGIVDTGEPADPGDGAVDPGSVKIRVDRLAEFLQIYNEAWRIQRDWFYDPGMHGVDWVAIGDKYRRFVRYCGNRSDLNYLIGEMIAELNAGHTYVYGGEMDSGGPRIRVGLLGADFDTPPDAQYHRIARIVPGNGWHPSERSPLAEPGCGIREGDWLLAINGEPIFAGDNVYQALEDTVGHTITVTAGPEPTLDGSVECRVRPVSSTRGLRYRAWVDANRRAVDEASGGRIGYLHIPDMMDTGLVEFARGWYSSLDKPGLIVDVRYNGGGFVGDMIIDRLERSVWSYTQPREGRSFSGTEGASRAHLVVIINQDTGSNGEYFSEAIKIKGLAPIIGMRTWGGAVGIEPHQDLVDGGVTTPPQFAPFGLDGVWLIEGIGVVPDIEVENWPADVLAGKDDQLDAAIANVSDRIEADPREMPARPPYPDKSKPQ